jgi:hypothetical protein
MRYVTFVAGLIGLLLTACSTPGLYETVPTSKLTGIRKIVVISMVGDKVAYQRQGWFTTTYVPLNVSSWRVDDTIATRTSFVIEKLLKIPSVPHLSNAKDQLQNLYIEHPYRLDNATDFDRVNGELRRIVRESEADTAVVVFKGGGTLPGTRDYLIQGPTVSNQHGCCSFFPVTFIALLDKDSLQPIATNIVRTMPPEGNAPRGPGPLPEDLCEAQLQDLSEVQVTTFKGYFFDAYNIQNLAYSASRLVAVPAK